MQLPGAAPRKFCFGQFEVDEATRTVCKHGLPVQVRGQSLDVLLALLKHPGEVLKRDELKTMLWPGGTHVEFETGLNSIVNRLRDALGDRAAKAKYIETLPRLGYRFVGRLHDPIGEPGGGQALRLVVLPFANLSGDPAQEYLCDGLTEELIGQLAMLGGGRLSVIARTSSMHYKGTRKGIASIARELQADYVLEGSVRRAGERVRVSAQFIEATGQSHVWANTYEGELGDLLHFQEQVGLAVAGEIRCAMAASSAPAIKQQAYDAYLRGRFQAVRLSTSGLAGAVEYFEEAVSIEPGFAKAWAMLAQVWADSGFWNHAPASEAYTRAGYAADRALSLDDTLAEAHRALGTVHWFHHWDLERAGREFLRAVELKPGDAAARLSFGTYLASMEPDSPRARAEAARARELDPLSALTWGNSAWVHLWSREYEQAIRICRRAIEMDDQEPSAYYVLGLSLAGLRRWEESIRVFESGTQLQCGNMMLAYLATSCAYAGERARAVELLAELERRSKTQPVLPTSFAFVHMGLGNHEIAINWLDRAMEERDPHVLWLRTSPRWDPVRGHPRFAELVKRLPSAVAQG